jgi:hypothetical protein
VETGIKSWTQGRSWNLFYCCLLQTEQTLPLTDVDVCEDPKRLKREWETPTEVAIVWTEVLVPPELSTEPMSLRFSFPIELRIDTGMEGRGSSLPSWAVDNVRGGNDIGPRTRLLSTLRTRLLSMRCFRRIGILFATNNLSPFCRKSRCRLITRR